MTLISKKNNILILLIKLFDMPTFLTNKVIFLLRKNSFAIHDTSYDLKTNINSETH